MDEEINAIEKNKTWELVELSTDKKPIRVKWVYKTKYKSNGEIDSFKARLVANVYKQKTGIDYFEVFAPIARLDTIHMLISLSAQNNWKIYQMNVKSAFLNRTLEEEVYVEQPAIYIVRGKEDKVYRLKKALYGLKQTPRPRAWYKKIDSNFLQNDFQRCPFEHTVYIKFIDLEDILIVCLYVDYLVFTGNSSKMEHSKPISTPIEEKLKLTRQSDGKRIDSTHYKSLIGSLRYLTSTRSNIVYGVGLFSRYMEEPCVGHLQGAKRILRYIKGTLTEGIFYANYSDVKLVGYTDSDWA